MSIVVVEQADAIRTLTLNRPDKLNAFDVALRNELRAALEAAAMDDAVRVVVLTGSGRGFSSGQDLDELVDASTEAAFWVREHLRGGFNPIVLAIRGMGKPVIAAINGVAAGIGLSIALACDLRIAAASAQLTLGFSKIGLVPDGGATLLLPLLAGFSRALELAWTSDVISAGEAQRLGVIDHVVPDEELGTATQALAQRLVRMPAGALALTKNAFNAALCPQLPEVLEREAELQERAAAGPDLRAAVRAFQQKQRRTS